KSIASWRCRSPKIQQILDKRFNFIYGYAHGVGYVLDPRYLGKGMDDETRGSVKYFVGMWHGADRENGTMVQLVKFLGGSRDTSLKARLLAKKQLTLFLRGSGAQLVSAQVHCTPKFGTASGTPPVKNLVFRFFNAKNFDGDDMAFYDMLETWRQTAATRRIATKTSDYEYY
ncbi:hypothetical protein L914_08973, partial [Phytophthora nicotianae]